jgi:uncharacterized cupredoxin-like copper-binding protein
VIIVERSGSRVRRALVAIALALVIPACAASSGAGSGGVDATLNDRSIELSATDVPSGDVTFHVSNAGTMTHEFEVFGTDLDDAALPVDNGVVQSDGLRDEGEVEDVAPGTSVDFDLNLDPGHYVAICNLPGHYLLGMHVAFTVG